MFNNMSFRIIKDENLRSLTSTYANIDILNAKNENIDILTVKDTLVVEGTLDIVTENTFTLTTDLDGQTSQIVSTPTANPFHGWWAKENKSIMGGLGDDFVLYTQIGSDDIDAIIFIDTTQDPIVVTTMGGTGKHFRSPQPNEVASRPTYTQVDATSLVSTLVANPGDPYTELFGNTYPTLKLQSDGSIFACTDAGTATSFGNIGPTVGTDYIFTGIYKKRSALDLPAPFPRYDQLDYLSTDYTRPTQLARYIFDRLLYHGIARGGERSSATNWNPDFVGFQEAEALFTQYLTTGKTYTSNIIKTRTTKNGSGMTNIFTDTFHYAPVGSTVTLAGFGGGWAVINGTYVNGSSVHAFGGIPNPGAPYVDVGVGGTWHHYFYLNYDSSALPQFAANAGYPNFSDGSANSTLWGGGAATLSVTHRITDDMEYPVFVAAITALMYDAFKVCQHTGIGFWVPESNPRFVFSDWDTLQTELTADTALARSSRSRTNRFSPHVFYHNASTRIPFDLDIAPQGTYPWDFNDGYGCLPIPGNIFDYNVDGQNYLVGVSNLYYTLTGTPTKPQHTIAGLFGYKNSSGTNTGGAYFTSIVAPMNFANVPAGNPDPNVWSLLGIDFDGDETRAANNLYFGFVNPLLTPGKKIGYIYVEDEVRADLFLLMASINFTKIEDQDSPRFGVEGYARVWAPMMTYLNTQHPSGAGLDSIIIVDRNNGGGFSAQVLAFSSLFGTKRHSSDGYITFWRDNGSREPDFYSTLGYNAYNDLISSLEQQEAFIYADQTATRYGASSVFTGGKVVFLHNEQGASAGDILIPVGFLGELNDRQLGAGTSVTILGSIDGRLKGGSFLGFNDCMPKQAFSERLVDTNGDPVSAIPLMRLDVTYSLGTFNGRKITTQDAAIAIDAAPTITGGAGGNPLPEDYEQTIHVDFGFLFPHPDAPLPGWVGLHGTAQPNPLDNTTWRDRCFEQAILAAM